MLLLAPQIALGLAPGNPQIYLSVSPGSVEAEAGGTVTVTVNVISQEGYEANTQMSLVDPPAGVTATFDPNPVDVPGYDMKSTVMTINVASTAAQGEVKLQIYAQCVEIPECSDIDKTKEITLTISGQAANGGNGDGGNGGNGVIDGATATVTVTATPTVTVSTTVTTATTVVSTVTDIMTTRTPSIGTKTTVTDIEQTTDLLYPVVVLAVVVGALAVAGLALRKPE